MERRTLVRMGAALVVGASLAGGAEAGVARLGADTATAFTPAVNTWLADLAKEIAANEMTGFLEDGIGKAAKYWRNWLDGVRDSTQGYGMVWKDCYGHVIPPVILLRVTKQHVSQSYSGDPMKDGLLACVDGGNSAIYFEPWAWQALSMYVHAMTDGLSGQNLANAQRVCVTGLIPSGTRPQDMQSPEGLVESMTYETRSGPVEIGKLQESDGQYTASVKATGIWGSNQQPLVMQFMLPSHGTEPYSGESAIVRATRGWPSK